MKNNTSHHTSILTCFTHIGDIVNSFLGGQRLGAKIFLKLWPVYNFVSDVLMLCRIRGFVFFTK